MQRLADYNVSSNWEPFGSSWKTYAPKDESLDKREIWDALEADTHRPYLVQMTCLIESPMKMFVQN